MKTNPANAPLNLDTHADHAREVQRMDRTSAMFSAVAWLVGGETTHATAAIHRLDDDVVALAASVGVQLSILAAQVMADRANPLHLPDGVDGSPLGAGRGRAI